MEGTCALHDQLSLKQRSPGNVRGSPLKGGLGYRPTELFIGDGAIARHGADPDVITSFTPRHAVLVKELYPAGPRE